MGSLTNVVYTINNGRNPFNIIGAPDPDIDHEFLEGVISSEPQTKEEISQTYLESDPVYNKLTDEAARGYAKGVERSIKRDIETLAGEISEVHIRKIGDKEHVYWSPREI